MKIKPLVLALLLGSISIEAVKVREIKPKDKTNLATSIDQQVEEGAVKLGDYAIDEIHNDILMFQDDGAPKDEEMLDTEADLFDNMDQEDYMLELLDLDIEDQ